MEQHRYQEVAIDTCRCGGKEHDPIHSFTLTDYLKQRAIPPQHNLVSVEKAKQAVKEWLLTQPTNAWRDEIINMVDEP